MNNRKTVTMAWKVYGADGHRQRMSFFPSTKNDFSESNYTKGTTRIIEVLNSDITNTNEYSIIVITMDTAELCEEELQGQLSDGFFENCRTGCNEERVLLKDLPKRKWIEVKNEEEYGIKSFELKEQKVNMYVKEDEFGKRQGVYETLKDAIVYDFRIIKEEIGTKIYIKKYNNINWTYGEKYEKAFVKTMKKIPFDPDPEWTMTIKIE